MLIHLIGEQKKWNVTERTIRRDCTLKKNRLWDKLTQRDYTI